MAKKNESSNSQDGVIELDPKDVNNPEGENEEEEILEDEDSENLDPGAEDEDSEDQEDSDGEGEYEIVLEGDDGLSDKELKTQKFHNRMNERKTETLKAKESEDKANAELISKNEENKLLRQLLEEKGHGVKSGPPNPDDPQYEGGTYDPKYIEDLNAFHANQATRNATENLLRARAEDEHKKKIEDKKKEVEKSYENHYQRATDLDKKLKKKDYDEMEKVALDILGEAKADFLVDTFDHSEMIFYKFGKDPKKAKYFSDLLERSPGRALKELGVYESKIKQVKRKINKAADPESKSKPGYIKSKKGERGPKGAKYF
jgi:hypothetical protein